MERLKLLAAVFYYGLGCGLFSIDDVIHWSDNVIEVLDNPPYVFIELSMMSSAEIDNIKDKLFEIYRNIDIDTKNIVNMLLAMISRKWSNDQLNLREAIRSTVRLLQITNFYSNREYYELSRLDDAYDLAASRIYGNLQDVVNEFSEAISQYKPDYTLFIDLYRTVMNSDWEFV